MATDLTSLDHEDDDPGTVWNKEARERDKDRMSQDKLGEQFKLHYQRT